MPNRTINLNADIGESFGNYSLGADEEMMEHVPTANIACGFHAGDPHVMRATVGAALERGMEVGAHVSLPDLLGFGRRRMDVSAEQLRDYVLFQIGALDAFVRSGGGRMTHVKPHGILYTMCGERDDLAAALIEAVAGVDPEMRVIVGGEAAVEHGARRGVRVTSEGYVDLEYRPNGYPLVEQRKKPNDPDDVARRAVRIVTERAATVKETGETIQVDVPTICLHGDAPNAGAVAGAVRRALLEAEVEVVGLAEAMDVAAAPASALVD